MFKNHPTIVLISRLPWWLKGWSICLQCRRPGFDPWVGKITWIRKWPPTPVFLPGESHGHRSLTECSQRDRKESGTTERGTLWPRESLTSLASCSICHFVSGLFHPFFKKIDIFHSVLQFPLLPGRDCSTNSCFSLRNSCKFALYLCNCFTPLKEETCQSQS